MNKSVKRVAAVLLAAALAFLSSEVGAARLDYVYDESFGDTGRGRDELERPSGMSFSPKDLLAVAESRRNTIQFYDKSGIWLRSIGSPKGDGAVEFKAPSAVAFDSAGRLWVADAGNNRLLQINPFGVILREVGESGIMSGEFHRPSDLTYGNGRLFVADSGNKRIQIFSGSGEYLQTWNDRSVGGGAVKAPVVIAWSDENDGRLWVVNEGSSVLHKLDMSGRTVLEIDLARVVEGDIRIVDLHSDPAFDRLFVCDAASQRVIVLAGGKVLTRIELPPGVKPGAMALSWNLDLYVADRAKGRILHYRRR